MTKFFKSTIGSALGVMTFIAAAAPMMSHADGTDTATTTVQIRIQDANTPDGAKLVYSKLKQAADAVCGTSDNDADVIYRHGSSACVKQAIADAVRRINTPALASVYVHNVGTSTAKEFGVTSGALTAQE